MLRALVCLERRNGARRLRDSVDVFLADEIEKGIAGFEARSQSKHPLEMIDGGGKLEAGVFTLVDRGSSLASSLQVDRARA